MNPRDDKVLQSDEVRYFWYQYLDDHAAGESPYASPIRAETLAGLPPALGLPRSSTRCATKAKPMHGVWPRRACRLRPLATKA
jgi:acetyl esterase/lipase